MELNDFKFDTPIDIDIINPATQEKTGAVFSVYSPHSKVSRDLVIDHLRNKKEGDKDMTDEEYYSKVVTAWSGITRNGKEVPCNPENVMAVLTEQSFITLQLKVALRQAGYSPKQ